MDFSVIRKALRGTIAALFVLLAVIALVALVSGSGQQSVSLLPGDVVSLDDGWYTRDSGGTVTERALPVRIQADADGLYRMYRMFYAVRYDRYLCFYVHHQRIRVTLDGILLYSYEPDPSPSWIHTYRAFHHIVVLPQDMEGELCVQTEPLVPSSAGEYKGVITGDCSRILLHILKERWYKLFVGSLLAFVGIVFIIMNLIFAVYSRRESFVRSFGFLMLVIGIWQMEESRALQLMFGSQSLHWCLEYILPLSIPFLVLLFIQSIVEDRYRTSILSLLTVDIVVTLVQVVLQLTGAVQLTDSVILSYVLYVVSFVFSVVLLSRCMKFGSPQLKGIFIASMVAGLLLFIINSFGFISTPHTDGFLMLGLLLIFTSLGITVYQQMASRFDEMRMSEMYRRLALVDISTGAGSRAAWFSYVDSFKHDAERTDEACLILFDMNNLKKLNDTYGHLVGDRVIESFCACLKKAFGQEGKIYRIGGDEFICYCDRSPQKKVYQMLSAFDELVSEQALTDYPFSVAYGASFFIPRTKADFEAAQQEADKRMYECKEAMKSGRS